MEIPKDEKILNLQILKQNCRKAFGLKENEHIELCKYIPHEFEWKHIDPNINVEERSGKKSK